MSTTGLSIEELDYDINRCWSAIESLVARIEASFESLNSFLERTVNIVSAVESRTSASHNIRLAEPTANPDFAINNVLYGNRYSPGYNADEGNEGGSKKEETSTVGQVWKAANATSKLTENGMELLEMSGKLPHSLKNVKNLLGVFNGVGEFATAGGEFVTALEGTAGVLETVAATGELLAGGLEAAVAAGTAAGPIGWPVALVAGGALLTHYLVSSYEEDQKKQEQAKIDAKKEQHAKSTYTMSEGDAVDYVENIYAIADLQHRKMQTHPWAASLTQFVKGTNQQFGEGSGLITTPMPMATADNVSAVLDPHLTRSEIASIKKPAIETKHSMLEQTFGFTQSLIAIGEKNGREAFEQNLGGWLNWAREKDKTDHTHFTEFVKYSGRSAAMQLAYFGNSGRQVPNEPQLWADNKGTVNGSGPGGTSANGKVVYLTMNRALIENFTIRVNNATEGTAEIRREVEKVLMEIVDELG